MTTIRTRGTCGEIIQGFYLGQECLISCPIDLYTTVTVVPGTGKRSNLGYKSLQVLELMQNFGIIEKDVVNAIDIELKTELPTGKGYASSTADISAVAAAVAVHFGRTPDSHLLARLCVEIEPTDSTMFPNLTLFNHLKGEVLKTYDWCPDLEILILETDEEVDTIAIRKTGLYDRTRQDKSQEPLHYFEKAVAEQSLYWLGRAMEKSASENQFVLHKPELERIMDAAHHKGAIGVNTAHSGSTVGIFFEGRQTSHEEILAELRRKNLLMAYNKSRTCKLSAGTYEIVD